MVPSPFYKFFTRFYRIFRFPQMLRTSVRRLDALPGGLAWLAAALVVLGAWRKPGALLVVVSALAVYLAVRVTLAAAAGLYGLHLIRRWQAVDWAAEAARLAVEGGVHHLVLIPNRGEDEALLARSLDHLATQPHAQSSISVVLAMEATEPGAADKGARLQTRCSGRFAHVFVTVHPANLPGEWLCKSANLAWAGRWAARTLVEDLGYPAGAIVVTAMDADTLWHPAYFDCLSVRFAADPRRYETFWQAPIRYHANVWQAYPWLRVLHAYASAWELAYLAAPWWQALPMSSYSLSLTLLERTGYWDPDVIADEWHIYLKACFQQAGRQRLQPVFLPFLAQATGGSALIAALIERYRQTLRHAWGAKEIGYTLGRLLDAPSTPGGWGLLARVAHDNLMAGAGWIVLVFGSQLPLLLHPTWMRDQVGTAPFLVLQGAALLIGLLVVLLWVIDVRLRPARPPGAAWRDRLWELASLPLLAVLTALCVALPVLHAQTRLMFGGSLRFRVTPKR